MHCGDQKHAGLCLGRRPCTSRRRVQGRSQGTTHLSYGWHWKAIGHLFYTASSFVHHSKATGEFKLELQSGNPQFGSKLTIFMSRVTLKCDGWHWKTIGHLFYPTLSFVHYFKAIGDFKVELGLETLNWDQNLRFSVLCDLEIWRMTLKNNRAPLLCYFRLCASFHSHWWIQTGVTIRKRLNWVLTSVTLTFDLWSWPLAWTWLLSLVITPENFMMIRWWEQSEKGVTDRRTDRQTDGRTEPFIELPFSQLKWHCECPKW